MTFSEFKFFYCAKVRDSLMTWPVPGVCSESSRTVRYSAQIGGKILNLGPNDSQSLQVGAVRIHSVYVGFFGEFA